MNHLTEPRHRPGELEPVVIQVHGALAARLRLEALQAWRYQVRRISLHPRYQDEEREEFVQGWIGAHLEEALDVVLRVAS